MSNVLHYVMMTPQFYWWRACISSWRSLPDCLQRMVDHPSELSGEAGRHWYRTRAFCHHTEYHTDRCSKQSWSVSLLLLLWILVHYRCVWAVLTDDFHCHLCFRDARKVDCCSSYTVVAPFSGWSGDLTFCECSHRGGLSLVLWNRNFRCR